MIDPERLKTLLRTVDITVVARDLGLLAGFRPARNGCYGRCPFCHQRRPKFHLYNNLGRGQPGWFRCYHTSCGKFGDAIALIRLVDNLNFGDAVSWLARQQRVDLTTLQVTDDPPDLDAARRR